MQKKSLYQSKGTQGKSADPFQAKAGRSALDLPLGIYSGYQFSAHPRGMEA